MLFQRPNRQNPSDVQKRLSLFKFACSHLHLCRFPNRSTSANLNTDRAPPSPNLLADICTCGVFPAASPQPTSIPTGYRHPQICLQTFAPALFPLPFHLRQPQYRRGTATPKFACRHLHLCRFPNRFTSANLNTDGAPLTRLRMPDAVSVRRISGLPPASFSPRLATTALPLAMCLALPPALGTCTH